MRGETPSRLKNLLIGSKKWHTRRSKHRPQIMNEVNLTVWESRSDNTEGGKITNPNKKGHVRKEFLRWTFATATWHYPVRVSVWTNAFFTIKYVGWSQLLLAVYTKSCTENLWKIDQLDNSIKRHFWPFNMF